MSQFLRRGQCRAPASTSQGHLAEANRILEDDHFASLDLDRCNHLRSEHRFVSQKKSLEQICKPSSEADSGLFGSALHYALDPRFGFPGSQALAKGDLGAPSTLGSPLELAAARGQEMAVEYLMSHEHGHLTSPEHLGTSWNQGKVREAIGSYRIDTA